jgi:hypothetical protein
MPRKFIDLTGQRFERLVVKRQIGLDKRNHAIWECICDCGNIKNNSAGNLKQKNAQSCGCLRKEMLGNVARRKKGQSGFSSLKNKYKKGARTRNLVWNLNEEQLICLFKGNCYYCNIEPLQSSVDDRNSSLKAIKHSEFIYNGIDRIDNNIGYEIKNCVSCCKFCNYMKLNFTIEEFLDKIKKIAKFKIGMK